MVTKFKTENGRTYRVNHAEKTFVRTDKSEYRDDPRYNHGVFYEDPIIKVGWPVTFYCVPLKSDSLARIVKTQNVSELEIIDEGEPVCPVLQ